MRVEKVGKILSFLILGAAIAVPATANLRAPRLTDGALSGSLRPAARIRLAGEKLEASFPVFDLSKGDYLSPVWFRVVYEVENPDAAPARVALRFLAVDIRDLRVEIDGREATATVRPAPEETTECLAVMMRHREGFLPGFYDAFLKRVPGLKSEGGVLRWSAAFFRSLEKWDASDPSSADFEAVLPPGRSRITVAYAQRLFIEERGHGYFAAWPKKGVTGFDYLLYPAKTWPTAPGFKLEVAVQVPQAMGKKLLFNVYKKPWVKSNLPLKEVPGCAFGNGSTYKGEFAGGMPADVLTFLLWFDEGAASYVR